MELLNRLDQPSREYTPIPFWFLNGDLTHREIRRQLQDFCDHGVYGVVLHPRIGLSKRIGYLSPLFFRYLRTAIETAAELDNTVLPDAQKQFISRIKNGSHVIVKGAKHEIYRSNDEVLFPWWHDVLTFLKEK